MMNKRLNSVAKFNGKFYINLTLLALITGFLAIGQAYFIATIVDEVFLKNKGLSDVSFLLIYLLLFFCCRSLLSYITTVYGVKLASFVKRYLRLKLLEKLSKSESRQLYKDKTGKHVSVLTDSIDQLDSYFSSFLPQVFQAAIVPLLILIIVFSQNILSGIIMLVTAPLIPVFMIIIGSMSEKKSREQMDSMLKFSGHFLDVLQGLPILKVFGQTKRQRMKILEMSNQFRDTTMEVLKIAFLSSLMLEILATIATAMIAVEVGLRLVYGNLTYHTAFFVLLLAPELYLPLKNLGSSFHSGRTSIAAAETIWDVVDNEETMKTWGNKTVDTHRLPEINVSNVSFKYREDIVALSNISLKIKSGQRVAFVGKSGSGKSTLLKLILGLMPTSSGEIIVNGVPLTQLEEDNWFKQVSYVSQEPYLFSGTIKENIMLGNMEASDEEIYEAGRLAGVEQFVKDLPDGYETYVGEGGQGLSGGEKQRVAIARIFLKKAPLVLLDEPTAGLDLETEQLLKEALDKLSEEATVIIVAHRLQTIVASDQIVLFSEGHIVASGTHDELLSKSKLYETIVSVYRGEHQ